MRNLKLFFLSLLLLFVTSSYSIDPQTHAGEVYEFGYGIPIKFLMVYSDNQSRWLFMNLFSSNDGIYINYIWLIINLVFFYIIIMMIKKLINKIINGKKNRASN